MLEIGDLSERSRLIEIYVSLLPDSEPVRAQIKAQWEEHALDSFKRWLQSGNEKELEYQAFCDAVVKAMRMQECSID